MHTIRYWVKINKHSRFGFCYPVWKLRTAHVDNTAWQRLKGRPFSLEALWLSPFEGAA